MNKIKITGEDRLNINEIQKRAEKMRQQVGGTIFGFPINEADPLSKYAVTVYTVAGYNTYPEPLTIQEAAAGILETLNGFKENGMDDDYERNVRLVSYDAQLNAPDVTMRRLRNTPRVFNSNAPVYEEGVDVTSCNEEEGDFLITARGLLKWTYIEMIENKNPKAIQFMHEYYKLLAIRKYGKTAAAIKQEVRRMNRGAAIAWIEQTHQKYVHDDTEIISIMDSLTPP